MRKREKSMKKQIKEAVIKSYENRVPIEVITQIFKLSAEEVKNILGL